MNADENNYQPGVGTNTTYDSNINEFVATHGVEEGEQLLKEAIEQPSEGYYDRDGTWREGYDPVEAAKQKDHGIYAVHVKREAFDADVDVYRATWGKEEGERRFFEENAVTETVESEGNLLMTAGVGAIWSALTSSTNANPYDNAHAAIGVGDSTTAEVASQTNLQAGTNAYRQVQDATYPILSTNQAQFKITVGTGNANFSWQEWGVFNVVGSGSPPTGGTMLNRKVTNLGVKTSAASWAFTVTLSLT